MTDITSKDHPTAFRELCQIMRIEYPSTIHRFERSVQGVYTPVLWSEVRLEQSTTERVLQ
jgi:hypothetical protein